MMVMVRTVAAAALFLVPGAAAWRGGASLRPSRPSSALAGSSAGFSDFSTELGSAKTLLGGIRVTEVSSGKEVPVMDWKGGSKTRVYAFLTHFGDFNSWEYGEKLLHYLPRLDDAGVDLAVIGIGSPTSASIFAEETGFPKSKLYADPTAECHKALGFSNGFEPPVKVNAYLRLLPMLAGIGSPGTLQAVIKGYIGNPSANADWITSSLSIVDKSRFDVLGKTGARPFEVATLRLQNMIQILGKWKDLIPEDTELITQQGGTVIFKGDQVVYGYKDRGILVYTPIEDVLSACGLTA